MESYLIFLMGTILSCIINSMIVFQYIESSYEKLYNNKAIYIIIKIGISICMVLINLLNNPVINLVSWVITLCCIVIFLYNDYDCSNLRRIYEILVLVMVLTVCETIGYIIFEFIIWILNIDIGIPLILQGLKITFSKLSLLILYYLFIIRIWKSSKAINFNIQQYFVYSLIIVFSILNLILILIVVDDKDYLTSKVIMLLLINMFGIVFLDLFFLFFTKFTEENGQLKLKLQLLEQQSELQYNYYVMQEEKYEEAIRILHDVNKHLNMIEEIYKLGKENAAKKYTEEIQTILQPLIPKKYTNNTILNILLNDKMRSASLNNIQFSVVVGAIDLKFMDPIEVTTVFGNLLDNAIEACQKVLGKKYINMKLDTYNGFIAINITNSMYSTKQWERGKTTSNKGENHGIGLTNVENIIKKYDGNIILENSKGEFSCNIIFNG